MDSYVPVMNDSTDEMICEMDCEMGLRHREVTGSNPIENLNFSSFSTQVQKLRLYLRGS